MTTADAERLEVAVILNEASAMVGARPLTFGVATSGYAAFGTWMDQQIWSWNETVAMLIATALLGGVLQYLVLQRTLGGDASGWIGTMRALSVASMIQLGIWLFAGLGYLLLLLPGLYLAARMSAAVGMVVVERTGLAASIAGSWKRTRRSVWPLVIVHALLLFPLIVLTVAIGVAEYAEYGSEYLDGASTELAFISNLALGVMTMAGWAVAGAVYRLTASKRDEVQNVFA